MSNSELITPIAPRRADPERVETELMQLWNDVTNELGTDAVLRARSLTLVAYTDDPDREAELQETLASVSRRHPCRAIVVVQKPETAEGPALDAWVSVHCQRNDHTSLCNEQVMIEVQPDALEQVASLVLALVVSDLPIAVWWWGDVDRGSHIFDALYTLSDRFLLDATTFEQPVRSLAAEAGDLLTREGYPIVADLAWEEAVDWRDLITQLFDVPDWAAHLSDVTKMRLFYAWTAGEPRNPTEAFLIAGWIAHRLGWQPASSSRGDDAYTLTFEADGRPVHVEVQPTSSPMVFRQGIAMMEMETATEPALVFHISRDEDEVCGTLKVTRAGETLHQRTVSIHTPNRVDDLDSFLTHLGRDELFGDTLRLLAPLLEELT